MTCQNGLGLDHALFDGVIRVEFAKSAAAVAHGLARLPRIGGPTVSTVNYTYGSAVGTVPNWNSEGSCLEGRPSIGGWRMGYTPSERIWTSDGLGGISKPGMLSELVTSSDIQTVWELGSAS